MAFVDIGVGTAMLYGAGIGAAAGGIYAGATGKNVLSGALIGGAGGALLGGGAAGIAGASWGGAGADMVAADVASMQAAGLSSTQIASTLQASYGMSAADAAAAAGGSSSAATAATAANAANAANQAGNSSTAAGTSNAATNVAKNAMITPPPPPPSSSLIPGVSNSNLLGYGIPAAMIAYSTGMFGNNVNNPGVTQQATVGQSKPVPGIMSAQLSPNYKPYFQAKEGGIAKLATGGTGESGMTPSVTQSVYNPADVNQAQSNQLSSQTQALLNQYGINPTQATSALSALQSQGIGGTKTAAEGGIMGMAHGGKAEYSLGSYSDGGRLLKGPGDGMSDEIPATIAHKQPARLAEGEFVVPADVVSHLGNGSTDAGAKHLYKMMDNVRKARTGKPKQAKQIKADKYLPK